MARNRESGMGNGQSGSRFGFAYSRVSGNRELRIGNGQNSERCGVSHSLFPIPYSRAGGANV